MMRTCLLHLAVAATAPVISFGIDTEAGDPLRAAELNRQGLAQLQAGRLQRAEQILAEAARLAPADKTPEYQTNLALALLFQADFTRAETTLKRARFLAESNGGPDSI